MHASEPSRPPAEQESEVPGHDEVPEHHEVPGKSEQSGEPEVGEPSVVRRPGGRAARVREAVLAATRDELTAGGYGALNAARIAERAGVHRSTVHRRWPDLDELITEALIDAAGAAVPVSNTGDFEHDLRVLMHAIGHYVGTPDVRAQIRALVGDAARSPAIAGVVQRVWASRWRHAEVIIDRAVARRELRDDLPTATILAAFFGPLYLRVLFSDAPITDEFVDGIIDLGLTGARPAPSEPAHSKRQPPGSRRA